MHSNYIIAYENKNNTNSFTAVITMYCAVLHRSGLQTVRTTSLQWIQNFIMSGACQFSEVLLYAVIGNTEMDGFTVHYDWKRGNGQF